MHFIAWAVTPPRYTRRFDTRFSPRIRARSFVKKKNTIHSDARLAELVWLPKLEALQAEIPLVTGLVLSELEAPRRSGYRNDPPVPFYRMRHKSFGRELL